jgi:hypothetical protein
MSQQFTEKFTVPASSPYTYNLLNPTGATLVQVQSLAGVVVSGCSVASGVLTVPSGEASAILIVVYNATPSSSYTGSKAQAGRGAILTIGGVVIGELDEIPLKRGKWSMAKTTNFQSNKDGEQIPTIREPASTTLAGNRVSSDSGQAAVEAAYQNAALSAFVITMPINTAAGQSSQGDTYSFSAYVAGSDFTVQTEQVVKFSIELGITGPVTLAEGS